MSMRKAYSQIGYAMVLGVVLSLLRPPIWLLIAALAGGILVIERFFAKKIPNKNWVVVSRGTPRSLGEAKRYKDENPTSNKDNGISQSTAKISWPVFWLMFVVLGLIAAILPFVIWDAVANGSIADCSRSGGCHGAISSSVSPGRFASRVVFLTICNVALVYCLYVLLRSQLRK